MTPQECLVQICKVKNEMIYGLTYRNMFCEKDYADISNWSRIESKKVINCMEDHINRYYTSKHIVIQDSYICPWCIKTNDYSKIGVCNNCFYRCAHKQCDKNDSTYRTILFKLQQMNNISAIVQIPNLIKKIANTIKQFKSQGDKKEKDMIIYHIDDPCTKYGTRKINGFYDKPEYYGNIVTNKAKRTDIEYAYKFEAKGRWANHFSKEDFQWFKNKCKHVYVKSVSFTEFNDIVLQLKDMTDRQKQTLLRCIDCHQQNKNRCENCDVLKF